MKEIHTYMPFTFPVDPAVIRTMPEMDLSYALAGTLVEWSETKQLTAGLAESWVTPDSHSYLLTLRKGLKWSDGSPVIAAQVRASLLGGIKAHPDDLRSLANLFTGIECPTDREISFRLKTTANESGLLKKLTEPNYGIVALGKNGLPDLTRTTGPFFITGQSSAELSLNVNPNWHHYRPEMADRIMIRRPPAGMDPQVILLNDSWPSIAKGFSITPADTLARYEREGYALWHRPMDKIFFFALGRARKDAEHQALLRYLRANTDRNELTQGLSGFQTGDQLFPKGFALHDAKMSCPAGAETLPKIFRKRPLEIAFSTPGQFSTLVKNIKAIVTKLTGVEPHIIPVELDQTMQVLREGNFDIFAVPAGLADPEPEGIMSFYFEGEIQVIQSTPENDFVKRLDLARKMTDPEGKLQAMRDIVTDATCKGFVFPLFHLASLGIGRPDLDFSGISSYEESIPLAKIRFRSRGAR